MKTDVAVYVFCRNKADKIAPCIASVLRQTYPARLIFSDQYSEDGTYEVLETMLGEYHGPHDIELLRCPEVELRGMAGANAHINWMHDQAKCDLVIPTSCDDVMLPIRVEKTVEAYEANKPSVIIAKMGFYYPDTDVSMWTPCDDPSGFMTTMQMFPNRIPSSSVASWDWKFYQDIGGVHGVLGNDVYLPYIGTLCNGTYWLPEPLHVYMCYEDENNMGLEGRMRKASADNDEVKTLQLHELSHYQLASMAMSIYKKACEFPGWKEEAQVLLNNEIKNQFQAFLKCRDEMSIRKIQPLML
jgi:glycosyltransferase involved in cell wall biosynthesis